MYNEFRRQALDELFTRHNDQGFKALMDFYRRCLLSRQRLLDVVLSDMVNLARPSNSQVPLYAKTILTSAIENGQMECRNRNRVRSYLDAVLGPGPRRRSDPLH